MPHTSASSPKIFCVPGREETCLEAFGGLTWEAPVDMGYINLTEPFSKLPFSEQVETVLQRVLQSYWREEALLIGRSFGAWLLLQALMQSGRVYPGTVILLSSVLGYGQYRGLHFIAPRAARFWEVATMRVTPPAKKLVLFHGLHDEQCSFIQAERLSNLWALPLFPFEGGHDIGKEVLREEVSAALHKVWQPRG